MKSTELLSRGRLALESGHTYMVSFKPSHSNYYSDVEANLSHFAIWLSTNDVCNFSVASLHDYSEEKEKSQRVILFGDKADHDNFVAWRKDYAKRFPEDNMDNNVFPPLPAEGRYNLTFVNIVSEEEDDDDKNSIKSTSSIMRATLFEYWGWIVNNCNGMVFHICGTQFAFEREEDAFLFKMMHHV